MRVSVLEGSDGLRPKRRKMEERRATETERKWLNKRGDGEKSDGWRK